jgi:hypothetical protein
MGVDADEMSRRWDAAKKRYWTHLKKILLFFEVQ